MHDPLLLPVRPMKVHLLLLVIENAQVSGWTSCSEIKIEPVNDFATVSLTDSKKSVSVPQSDKNELDKHGGGE